MLARLMVVVVAIGCGKSESQEPASSGNVLDTPTARRAYLQQLGKAMTSAGHRAPIEAAGTDLRTVQIGGVCDQTVVDELAARMAPAFRMHGFVDVRCDRFTAPIR